MIALDEVVAQLLVDMPDAVEMWVIPAIDLADDMSKFLKSNDNTRTELKQAEFQVINLFLGFKFVNHLEHLSYQQYLFVYLKNRSDTKIRRAICSNS